VIGLLLSVLIHLYVWLMAVLVQSALQNGWLPAWLRPIAQPLASLVRTPQESRGTNRPPAERWEEIPLQFVEVDPLAATEQTPPETPLISTANTLAANPDPPKVAQAVPKIDGRREDSLKTFDTTQPSPTPPPPAARETAETAATPVPAVESKPKIEPKPAQEVLEPLIPTPGETQLAKADPKSVQPEIRERLEPQTLQKEQLPQEPVKPRRPRTLAEARASKGALVGERARQEGGVQRQALQSSLNVKASPLGDYNYRMVLAVQSHWYRLLEERHFALERQGQVVITFDLHADGTITGVTTKESNVGDVLSFLCELSVMQPAPFGKWPPDVRRLIGGDVIPVTFTFNYY
jgi:hypothetical protein